MITDSLGTKYHCYYGTPKAHYFNALLILKSPDIKCPENCSVVDFKYSRMGRYLIVVPVTYHSIDVQFMTSHIESLDTEHDIKKTSNEDCF